MVKIAREIIMGDIVLCTIAVLIFIAWLISHRTKCQHVWKWSSNIDKVEGTRKSKVLVLQCTKCGKVSTKEIR